MLMFIVFVCALAMAQDEIGEAIYSDKDYTPFDGWYNNRAYPSWGGTDTVLSRLMNPVYSDGVFVQAGTDRPNARDISKHLFDGESGLPSLNNKTALFVFFGQQVLQEVVDLERMGCPPEHYHIPINPPDLFDPEGTGTMQMPFMRTRYDQAISGYYSSHPREQLNQVTSYIDGGCIYGNLRSWAYLLRLRREDCSERTASSHLFASQESPTDCRGELASLNDEGKLPPKNNIGLPLRNYCDPRDHLTRPIERYFQLGNRMANENPFLLSLSIMWFRHHNWLARKIRDENKEWNDLRVFLEARIYNIAVFQKIAMYDWLPILIGNCTLPTGEECEQLPPYQSYDPIQPAMITNVFEAAAMRYLQTLFPPGVFIRSRYDPNLQACEFYNMTNATAGPNPLHQANHEGKPALRLCNAYWNSNEAVEEYDIAPVIMGMASQIAEREDRIITADLQKYYYGPRHFSRRDAVALAIQRGRDHGLPDYGTARFEFGYPQLSGYEDINPELFNEDQEQGGTLLQNITAVHDNGSLEIIDVFTGGMLETKDGNPGHLFRGILLKQFRRLRNGDRYWFENPENGLFTNQQRDDILQTTIRDVILRTNPDLDPEFDIQDNPFLWNPKEDQKLYCPQPFQIKDSDLEECEPLRTYDYFKGSDSPFLGLYCFLGAFIILVVSFMYLLGYISDRNRKMMDRYERTSDWRKKNKLTTSAVEILGKHESQKVEITLRSSAGYILISSLEVERKMKMKDKTSVYLSSDKGRNIMLVQNELATYDLILSFNTPKERQVFLDRLTGFLVGPLKDWTADEIKTSELLKRSYSKEKRDKDLASFFQAGLASSMNMNQEGTAVNKPDRDKKKKMLNIKISKHEFAHLLKMKEDSLFLQHLFAAADADNDELISFQEFLNIIALFTSGVPDEKLQLIFNMYDIDRTGLLKRDEFELMVRSMIESFSTKVDIESLNKSISKIMSSAGGDAETGLSFNDFKNLMMDYNRQSDDLMENKNYDRRLSESAIKIELNKFKQQHEISNERRVSEAIIFLPLSEHLKRKRKSTVTALERYRDSIRRIEKETETTDSFDSTINDDDAMSVATLPYEYETGTFRRYLIAFEKYIQYHTLEIFWLSMYAGINTGIFLYYFYTPLYDHSAGWLAVSSQFAIPVSAGASGVLMYNLATLLFTMCRNTITYMRDTWLGRYIPFDQAATGHVIVAWATLLFALTHVIAQAINYYAIATQYPEDALCLYPDYWYRSDYYPTFFFWGFQTYTGITGIILSMIVIIVYVFASEYARKKIYTWFNWTHTVGVLLLYLLIALHGNGMMLEMPTFFFYYIGPLKLFIFDKLYTLSRKKTEITVVKAELLPSDVTHLQFRRPPEFNYKAGQWVKLACPVLSAEEFHSITLTSAPHEELLSVHIRAVDSWSKSLRKAYSKDTLGDAPYPKLYVDGPYGQGHQDWYKYEVCVLIGGGIGVTPFASILKDWISSEYKVGMNCKRIYFLWVTRDQKQYEWLTEIVQDVEKQDKTGAFRAHIFITQFPEKFDLRTTMLYICEKNFHKVAGKSLFTGLKSETHFGRPNFKQFFEHLATRHHKMEKLGIFSKGPRPMTRDVEKYCSLMNQFEGPIFSHHSEN